MHPVAAQDFFSSYLTGLHYDELFFEQASAVRIHSGQKGYQHGLYCFTYHKLMIKSTSDLCSACNLNSYMKQQ